MPYNTYPESATNAAKKALKHKQDNGSDCGTSVGWTRARQLSGRESLSDDEVIRTYSFLSRAKVYDQGKYFDENENEICGSIMYDAWGGSTMFPWAEKTAARIMDERNSKSNMEKRNFKIEYRAEDNSRTIYGTATALNRAYDMGWFDEEVTMDAFAKTDMEDVVALFNHDQNMVLARTKSGTLKLNVTKDALEYSFDAPNTTIGNDLLEMVRRGDVYQSSFAFTVETEDWQSETTGMKPKRIIRSIKKVYDVSPVTYPANPDTMVAKRSYDDNQDAILQVQKNDNTILQSEIDAINENRRYALHLLNLQNQ